MEFFLGTYTNPGYSTSKGIYSGSIDSYGQFAKLNLMVEANNPSFLTKTYDGNFIAISTGLKPEGLIASYKLKDNKFLKLDEAFVGVNPCFVSVKNKTVTTANYNSGNFHLHQINNKGKFSLIGEKSHISKNKINHPRQDKPHAHSCYIEPKSGHLISVDLGINKLMFWYLQEDGILKPCDFPELEMPKYSGPRHLAFHESLHLIYVVNELNSTLSIVKKNIKSNTYCIFKTINTLPKDFTEENTSAHIEISNDYKFLYLTNRGHDSIAIFKIEVDGDLKLIEHVNVKGKHPRHFALSPLNDFLIVANRDSNNIVCFKRNAKTGLLHYTDQTKVDRATCVLFG